MAEQPIPREGPRVQRCVFIHHFGLEGGQDGQNHRWGHLLGLVLARRSRGLSRGVAQGRVVAQAPAGGYLASFLQKAEGAEKRGARSASRRAACVQVPKKVLGAGRKGLHIETSLTVE